MSLPAAKAALSLYCSRACVVMKSRSNYHRCRRPFQRTELEKVGFPVYLQLFINLRRSVSKRHPPGRVVFVLGRNYKVAIEKFANTVVYDGKDTARLFLVVDVQAQQRTVTLRALSAPFELRANAAVDSLFAGRPARILLKLADLSRGLRYLSRWWRVVRSFPDQDGF